MTHPSIRWFLGAVALAACGGSATPEPAKPDATGAVHGTNTSAEPATPGAEKSAPLDGKTIFRHDTFGNEMTWTDKLQMHTVVEQNVDPMTALSVGLKVDAEKLPPGILEKADLKSPKTTVALLEMDAVVGLKATVAGGKITKLGITCALCHSTVDNSVMPGIGKRLDGYPNRELNVGAIIALSPAIPADKKKVYNSWGPSRFDARFDRDGKSSPVLFPPAYGLADSKLATYTGDGDISYWNNYVAVLEMGGHGSFRDPDIGVDVKHDPDLVGPKLELLREYQHSLKAPAPPAGSFDAAAAERGNATFGKACASCHTGGRGTDANDGKLHDPAETGMDGTYASRAKTKKYRTTPLRALWQHPPYFHDGAVKTLADVVKHYDTALKLKLSAPAQRDLVEYLKSL
jgi:cytochrome c5